MLTHKLSNSQSLNSLNRIAEMRDRLNLIEKKLNKGMLQEVYDGAFVEAQLRRAWVSLDMCASDILNSEEVWID